VILRLLIFFALALPASALERPLVFTAMGCGPYYPADMEAAKFYVALENKATPRSKFMVHLGDICTGKAGRDGTLTEKTYSDIKDLFTVDNTIPSYIVPGDNEWNDRPDPDKGWKLWSKHLLGLEKNFETPWETARQDERSENFAFVADGVLIIGINLPGGRIHDHDEWARRFRQNNDWIEAQFSKHSTARAAVVCCQANVVGQGKIKPAIKALFTPFRSRFGKLAAAFEKPVLFLHADGHKWTVDNPWNDAPNITRLQVDRLEPKFPTVQITVDPDAKNVFAFERRLGKPDWKVPKP
jgi:hypothetical protein